MTKQAIRQGPLDLRARHFRDWWTGWDDYSKFTRDRRTLIFELRKYRSRDWHPLPLGLKDDIPTESDLPLGSKADFELEYLAKMALHFAMPEGSPEEMWDWERETAYGSSKESIRARGEILDSAISALEREIAADRVWADFDWTRPENQLLTAIDAAMAAGAHPIGEYIDAENRIRWPLNDAIRYCHSEAAFDRLLTEIGVENMYCCSEEHDFPFRPKAAAGYYDPVEILFDFRADKIRKGPVRNTINLAAARSMVRLAEDKWTANRIASCMEEPGKQGTRADRRGMTDILLSEENPHATHALAACMARCVAMSLVSVEDLVMLKDILSYPGTSPDTGTAEYGFRDPLVFDVAEHVVGRPLIALEGIALLKAAGARMDWPNRDGATVLEVLERSCSGENDGVQRRTMRDLTRQLKSRYSRCESLRAIDNLAALFEERPDSAMHGIFRQVRQRIDTASHSDSSDQKSS